MEEKYQISEKEKMMLDFDYENHEEFQYKICAELLQINVTDECYRDQLVSFYQMSPLINKTVKLEEADYILYANPYARVEDFTDSVLQDLEYIDKYRKTGSEIIIVGKATNIRSYIEEKYDNVTYVDSHYAEYIGNRFGLDIKDKYVVYDDRFEQLNIWPVDGCLNRCGFCRRCYMNIPFESQKIEFIKEQLDWFKKHHPDQMKHVSLRAENLTQYGLDLYGEQRLDEIINLIDSYEEVETIDIPIGMCIGEITDKILNSICHSNKIIAIGLNLEAGSDRLLRLIGKQHTKEQAIMICNRIRQSNSKIIIDSTVMVGLPTEGLEDILELSDVILRSGVNYIHCNYYGYSPKHIIAKYPQIDDNVRELHLKYLIKYLKSGFNGEHFILQMRHERIDDKRKRSVSRALEKLKEEQHYVLPRLLRVQYENFIGNDISIKQDERKDILIDTDEKIEKAVKVKRLTREKFY